jgi:hypothetical protein
VPVINGVVDIYNHVGTVDVIADVEAFYTQPGLNGGLSTGTSFTPTVPTRLLDTRDGTGGHTGAIGAAGVVALQVTGVAGIPADATSVVLNVTSVAPTLSTFVTVYPDGTPRPVTSNVNVTTGQTTQNLVVVAVGAGGKIDFFNNSGQNNVVADVAGYFTD